jgi:HlyD family secretion protein
MKTFLFCCFALFLSACTDSGNKPDAYGNFEVNETIVSAGANGALLTFEIEEGMEIPAGKLVGIIDTAVLDAQRQTLMATIAAARSRLPQSAIQLNVFEQQKNAAQIQIEATQRELQRVKALYAKGAATRKQVDDAGTQAELAQKQLITLGSQQKAQSSVLSVQENSILHEIQAMHKQIEQIETQIKLCSIVNPTYGTITADYASPGEIVNFGKPLYRIARLDTLIARAYVSGAQLSAIKLGMQCSVHTDAAQGTFKESKGKIIWISPRAEFTPKVIQTREDRVNFVYAVKIAVKNDGSLKMGMPAEVFFR